MIEFQQKIMGDKFRNDALARALKAVIRRGKTVVADIGSGTGFLSFLASRLGAKTCFLYEKSPGLFELSQKLAKENGIKNCHFFNAHSSEMVDPIKADVVISETLGNFAYEEHLIEVMNDAKRFLKPGGVVVPQKLTYYVAPVVSERLWKEVNVWDRVGHQLDFKSMKEAALQNMYVKTIKPSDLLESSSTIQPWDHLDFRQKNPSVRKGTVRWKIDRPTILYGLALFWDCELVPGVHLSTSPLKPLTHWEQIFLPVLEPIALKKGDKLNVVLISDSRYTAGLRGTWEITINQKRSQLLDMRKGFLE